jgi:flagella basal body P-ring formation protein FlgA
MKFVINALLLLMTMTTEAQVTLRFQSHITDEAKVLGDLLIIAPEEQKLAQLPLDSHPKAHTQLDKKQLMAWLQTQAKDLDYQWQGKNTAFIEPSAQTSGQALQDKAQAALIAQLNQYPWTHLEVITKAKPPTSSIALDRLQVQITNRYPPLKQIGVRLNDKNHSIPVWFKVKAYQKVLVAKQDLSSRTLISHLDFELQDRDIAGLKGKPYQELPQELWLTKGMKHQAILTEEEVSPRPQVLKGQSVHIKIISQGLSITTDAIAEQDGYLGQTIKMKNAQNKDYFTALITATNQAEVRA